MGQVYYQKPKRKVVRCCYCCIEVLSGFLLLMLVAAFFTLLRYFLEFSDISSTYAGSKVINGTTTPTSSSQPMLAERFESTRPLAVNITVSQEFTKPPKPPQSSSWGKMGPSQKPTEKSNPWILISASSPGELPAAAKPPSPPSPTPLMKLLSLPPQTTVVEWVSTTVTELVPTSATKPALPQPLVSSTEPSSAQHLTLVSSPRLVLDTETTLAAGQPVSPQPTTTPSRAFPQWLATKPTSSQRAALIKTTHRISSQEPSTAVEAISVEQPTSTIKWKYLSRFTTANNLGSPQPPTPPRQPSAAIKSPTPSLSSPQAFISATELAFPPRKTTTVGLSSPQNPTMASLLQTTQPPQPFSDPQVSGPTAEDESNLLVKGFKGPGGTYQSSTTNLPVPVKPTTPTSDPNSDSFQSGVVKLETIGAGKGSLLDAIARQVGE